MVAELVARDPQRPTQTRTGEAPWIERLNGVAPAQRTSELAKLLRSEVADTLGFNEPDSVPVDRNFYEIGMDSLMMADLVGRLKKRVGISCSALVFDHPNVQSLADRLIQRLPLSQDEGRSSKDSEDTTGVVTDSVAATTKQITGYDPASEAEIFGFQEAAWANRDPHLIPARWRWMFVDSARRLGVEPLAWLYRDAGRLVGHMGSIPVRVKLGTEERQTGWLVDTMVLKEYRSHAVGSRLMVEANEDQPFSLSLGQTTEMREIQLRLGWKQVAPLQVARLLLRPANVLKGKVPAPAAWAAGLGHRASSAVRDLLAERVHLRARPIDRFDERHDRLWTAASRDLTCAVVRDASYLNWKYVEQPGRDFLRIELLDGNELAGVAVWMFRDPDRHYRYRRGFLVDLVAPLSNAPSLVQVIKAACAAVSDRDVDALLCHHIDRRLTQALRGCGFHLRQPERFLLVDPGPLSGEPLDRVLSPESWFVTQGDSDIDRP